MYNSQDIAKRIKDTAKSKNIPLKEMFKSLKISDNTLHNMQNSFPKSDTLARIADYLGVSVDFLLGRERPALAASAPSLDSNAARMLSMFSQLSEEKQEFLLKQAEMYLDAEQPKEKAALV